MVSLYYDDILERAQMLSSFEGKRIVDGSGNSMYPVVHITEQDADRVKQLAVQACLAIQAAARYVFVDVDYSGTDSVSFLTTVGTVLETSSYASQMMLEAVTSYIMQYWLEDKSMERSKSYEQVFQNMLAAVVRLAHRKHPPKLENYDH